MHPSVFTIPPHRPFADALAAGLIALHGRGEVGLARGIVLVPNNRAARAVQDAFVRRSGGGLLLPRLVPVGDPELDERVGGALDPLDVGRDPIPPAIEPLERLMLLARLVQQHHGADAAESMRLAEDLGRTLDQLLIEEVDPARLAGFAADLPDLSMHWQKSLDQLRLILTEWPLLLAARGRIDLADRRNRLLAAVAARWRERPPADFVCAAGIDIVAPAVARLLRAVARLPGGMVVLPGLDLAMPEEEWDALGPHEADAAGRRRAIETHPQFHLKLLLDRMGVGRGEVRSWRWGGGAPGLSDAERRRRTAPAARSRAIAHAMTPPEFTRKWQALPPRERRLGGVRAIELADPAEEAQAIAIALREALETPGRTAALVTPDRALARRVSAHLRRWGIEADDSAGRPLSQTPPGTFLLALASAAAERFAPVPLLALLKHPLVRAGEGRRDWLDGVRLLDLALRGPRPPAGLDGVSRHLAGRGEAEQWWRRAQELLRPLQQTFETESHEPPFGLSLSKPVLSDAAAGVEGAFPSLSERELRGGLRQPRIKSGAERSGGRLDDFLAALRETASALGGDGVWAGPAGRTAAETFAAVEAAAAEGPERIRPAELPPMLERLLAGQAVRPPYGQHPRIFIWGLIEARLQQADLMILAGLNETVWPALPPPDPWLAPRLRAELGLPSLERRIGLAAHDFAGGLGAPQVLVSRARRDARSPAIASRFWLRLEAMTGGVTRAPLIRKWARGLDQPADHRPAPRPAPAPAKRPRRISVTEVDRLKADPYAFYARRILGLRGLDPVDADPTAAWRGSAVHKVLEHWMKEDDCDPARLRPRAEALLAGAAAHPLMRALWQPRLIEAIAFIAGEVEKNREAGRRPLAAEAEGRCELAGVELRGVADRIDRCADGTLAIVDYKTGQPPSAKAVAEGYSLQLGLLGLIAEHGGFDDIEGAASCFEYWSLARKAGRLGYVASPVGGRTGLDAADFTTLAARNFIAAAERWLTGAEPFTARLHPDYAPYGEYDQLMRLDEWYGRE